MKLANRGEADIKKSLCQDAAFLCTKISLNPMFRCMRSLCKDLDFSVKISKKHIFGVTKSEVGFREWFVLRSIQLVSTEDTTSYTWNQG